ILSDQLCANQTGNLTPKQVEFAKTIHSSGNDLLMLINDILDLSKIESGTVAVDVSELRLDDLLRSIERGFRHFAENKHLDFIINADSPLPKTMVTDAKRLQQIIKNLLSNAFKFTHEGHVAFTIAPAESGWSPDNEELNRASQVIAFSVSDTGIGISPDKQQIIFEAFQQADGSTSRKYGGTGLGLAISRELSRLLGGEIRLVSAPGKGSTFTLYLPQSYTPQRGARHARPSSPEAERREEQSVEPVMLDARRTERRNAETVPEGRAAESPDHEEGTDEGSFANVADDDRNEIGAGDRILLIVENDIGFAKVMLEAARAQGFKALVATTGSSSLAMTREYHPSLITLDIFLPDMQGWRILDRIKGDLETRHIPICVVSTDDSRDRALQAGALAFVAKPLQSKDDVDEAMAEISRYVERPVRRLLVAMRDSEARQALLACYGEEVDVTVVERASDAQERMAQADCMVVDADLSELGPEDVIEASEQRPGGRHLPVIVYNPEGAVADSVWLRRHNGFARREARSQDALMAHTAFFLHRSPSDLTDAERRAVDAAHGGHRWLEGRKALIVDDDMRNIFALATVLDDQGMEIVSADNGREAIRLVQSDPSIDIVLMDIMMPEMDGLTTMQEIRKLPRGKELPMVAVTAKAMKGDRQKCIEAGAWDYLSKPVDPMHLLAVLRGWLCR
ncbi:MAG TPA: response regulator, partial [Burkholderiaceae bacterium]|nr:response regulator [Burkholderiaceae bacterium]